MLNKAVSHYKILEKLGGGGMGVVYKAEDTRLHRTVALKFLLPELTRDEEAKKRFIHEAEAASSLDHHNICTIHEIDEIDGQLFICMNYYEGETLKKKIDRGALKLDEVVTIAIQVAQGLQKASRKGIVHRDIKPANIFVTDDGVVKILDFGLVKLTGYSVLTKIGETLGTTAYMSPEQARGDSADHRTDMWSLGVVMYEALTGKLPFRGEYEQAVIFSILNNDPEPLTDISTEVVNIVNKCLEKDKESRYTNFDELLSDLQIVKEELLEVSFTSGNLKKTKTRAGLEKRKKIIKRYSLWSIGVFFLLAIAGIIIFWPSGYAVKLNPNRVIRTLNLPFRQIMYPSISADGNWIAFPAADVNGDWNIYLSHSSSGEAPISLVNEKKQLSWSARISPDGSCVIYQTDNIADNIKSISSLGGVPKVLDSLFDYDDLQWKSDGKRIGGVKQSDEKGYQFWTSTAEGKDLRKEFSSPIHRTLFRNFDFAWSPDGKSIARLHDFREGSGYQEIFIVNLETGEEKQITNAKSNIEALCWSHQNMIIFSATISGPLNLWMVSAEGGDLIQLTSGDGPDGPPSISKDGSKIIYPKMKMVGQIMIVPVSGGEEKSVITGDQTIWHPGARLSPDGKHIAVNVGDLRFGWAGVRDHLYVMNRDGSNRRRITCSDWENLSGDWSPDGKWMLLTSNQFFSTSGVGDIYLLNVLGNNQPKKICSMENLRDANWIDSLHFYIKIENKFLIYSITDNKFDEDTVIYYQFKGRPEVIMQDIKGDLWLTKNDERHKIIQPENTRLSLRNLCWIKWEPDKPFRIISLIDGKTKDYSKLTGPKLLGPLYNLSDDGKEIIYSTWEFNGQISIIENPFLK